MARFIDRLVYRTVAIAAVPALYALCFNLGLIGGAS